MKTLFDQSDRESVRQRLGILQADSPRQWGKMSAAQMVTHCARALETGTGDRPMKQAFLGKVITPFIRSSILGEKPFGRNSPTDPSFVVADEREFAVERQHLLDLIDLLVERGTAAAATQTHPFFGKLSGEEWGRLMYKHIDHHLQQFGV
ncbi:MAG TPA: DUF1569 domain-containing protein [Thermoanaerobaculia bacterium]|nr:DUF1569 domain-containing protein [Thermoanaerobaculia bacterium]